MDTNKLVYRKLDSNDLDLFIKLRIDFLREICADMNPDVEEKMAESLKSYFKKSIEKNEFIGIICEYNGNAVSAAYLSICEKPAHPNFPDGREGSLLNVYTYPEYRKRGIAAAIVNKIIDEAKKINLSVIELTATKDGEKIYKNAGFKEHEDKGMQLKL